MKIILRFCQWRNWPKFGNFNQNTYWVRFIEEELIYLENRYLFQFTCLFAYVHFELTSERVSFEFYSSSVISNEFKYKAIVLHNFRLFYPKLMIDWIKIHFRSVNWCSEFNPSNLAINLVKIESRFFSFRMKIMQIMWRKKTLIFISAIQYIFEHLEHLWATNRNMYNIYCFIEL